MKFWKVFLALAGVIIIIDAGIVVIGLKLNKKIPPPITNTIVSKVQDVLKPQPRSYIDVKTPPSFDTIFSENHTWIKNLPADRVRTLITTGDVIPARSVNSRTVLSNNFRWPYEETFDYLKSADITLVNFETPLINNCPLTIEGMKFCGDVRNSEGLQYAGVDIAGLANNHSGNYGQEGIDSTVKVLNNAGIMTTGVNGAVYKNVRGLTFGFLSYDDVSEPVNEEKILNDIRDARVRAHILVVSFHWGIEYTAKASDRQKKLAHFAVDNGVDLVIGNHPHWIQPVEFYKNKYIGYAQGNFVFDQMWSLKTREGIVNKFTFYDNKLIDVQFSPVLINDYGQPMFLQGTEKQKILEELKLGSLNN